MVLAFARFLEHGQAHTLAANTFDLQGPWNTLGMDTGKLYTLRNRASSNAGFLFTNGWPRSGQDLFDNGIFVSLHAGDTGADPSNVITDDGAVVQYLNVIELDETIAFDADNDNLYDGWEWKHFNTLTNLGDGDNDNDGVSDTFEFIAGTEPTNSGSAFILNGVMSEVGPTNRSITIPTEPGRKYAIDFADGMISNNLSWMPFGKYK